MRSATLKRAGVLLAVVGISSLWLFAFFFADREFSGKLDDETIPAAAAEICDRYMTSLEEIPIAATARSPEDRADLLERANVLLRSMVAELDGLDPAGESDTQRWQRWLADWEIYIANREAYAATLATGSDARFQVATDEEGQIVTAKMDTFADGNGMSRCRTPDDA